MTDFRALCAELLSEFDYYSDWSDAEEVKERARAALAEPEIPSESPTDEELLRMAAKALGYESINLDRVDPDGTVEAHGDELLAFARAILARWGRPS